jgi:hypothetical protein
MNDDLMNRLDTCWAMLEEEGFYTKANTVMLAKNRIEELEREVETLRKALDVKANSGGLGMKFITNHGRIKIEMEVHDDSTLDEVLEEFENFLRACGYVIEYNQVLTMVDMDNE